MPLELRRSLVAAALLGTLAGCVSEIGPTELTPEDSATPETVVLGSYVGAVDLVTGELWLLPARPEPTSPLPRLDAGAYGSDLGAPAGATDMVELSQLTLLHPNEWDPAHCGPTPVAGVCVQIRARNLFPNHQLVRTYVELTQLTPRAPTTNIAARSNTTSDADYGVSAALGLWRYGRLNRAGVSGDSAIAYWPFVSTSAGPARFHFVAVVKAQLVAPIARVSTRSGTTDIPPPTYAAGTPANQNSGASRTAISATGRYVAFQSLATNLVSPELARSEAHVYRKDLESSATLLVDLDDAGQRVTGCTSSYPSISSDGSRVAFLSTCKLVAADTDALADVYVRDLAAGTTTLASVDSRRTKGNTSAGAPMLSGDGTHVVFESPATNLRDQFGSSTSRRAIYLRDLVAGTTMRVTKRSASSAQPDGSSYAPSISWDGNRIVYESSATNLRAPHTEGQQVFLYDVPSDTTTVMSLSAVSGALADHNAGSAVLSTDGTSVAFVSMADNLVAARAVEGATAVYVRSVAVPASLTRVTVQPDGSASHGDAWSPSLSGSGRYVLFVSSATDLLAVPDASRADVYVVDRGTLDPRLQHVERVSVTEAGGESASGAAPGSGAGWATISEDGVWAAFAFSGPLAGSGGGAQQVYRAAGW
jgi:Tol biopolymer transport system component